MHFSTFELAELEAQGEVDKCEPHPDRLSVADRAGNMLLSK